MKLSFSWPHRRTLLYDLCAILILTLLPFLVFWQIWAPNPDDRLMFSGDILMAAYPYRLFVHRLFELGMSPLWNPYQLGGMPLLGDVQVAPFYSLNLVLDLLYRGRPISYLGLELMTIFHYAVGGLFLYAYLRGLGVRPAAAMIGAIGFEFNGFFIGHRGHYNMLGVVVWLPGVLWLLDNAWRARRLGGGIGWATLAGLALSQLVMAGHPQLTLYCAMLIIGYFVYRWIEDLRRLSTAGWGVVLRTPLLFGLAGIIAGGIAAVALLPAAELLARSLRSTPTYAFAAEYSLLPRNLIGLFMPDFLGWGVTEYRIYAGILTMLLAAVAWIVPHRARPEQRFFTLAALAAVVVALGGFTIFHGIIYRFVPGFDGIRVSSRAFYLVNLTFCVLAAFGAETLLTSLKRNELRRLRFLTYAAGSFVAIALLLGTGFYIFLLREYQPVGEEFFRPENLFNRQPEPGAPYALLTQATNVYLLFVLFLAAASSLLWVRLHNRLTGRGLAVALSLLMFIDVATYAPFHDTIKADPDTVRFTIQDFGTTIIAEPWQISDQTQLIETLQQLPPHIRVDNRAEILPDNYSAVHQISFATGYNILNLRERFQLLTQWPYLRESLRHDLLNTGYLLTPADVTEAPEAGATIELENSQGKLWRRAVQPTYARFSTQIRPAETLLTINGLLNLPGQQLETQPSVSMADGDLRGVLKEAWSTAADPSLYAIGTTGVESPVDISVLAGGSLAYSAVIVDGETVTPEQRGIVLAIVDPDDGTVLGSYGFDTYLSAIESDRLAATINAAKPGSIIALATYDEGTANLTDAARTAIAGLGAATPLVNQFGAAYALIGVKGAAAGSALEQIAQQAITIDVGIGAYQAEPDETFTNELLRYQPNRISLAVHNQVHGLLTVSEAVFPGWQAYLDGEPVPTLRTNGLQRGIILPPSRNDLPHEVTFVYEPLSVRLGGGVTILMLSVAGGLLLAVAAQWILEIIATRPRRPLGMQPQLMLKEH